MGVGLEGFRVQGIWWGWDGWGAGSGALGPPLE